MSDTGICYRAIPVKIKKPYLQKEVRPCIMYLKLALVAVSPDTHLFSILDQLITEVRVGNRDKGFSALPGRKTLQVYLSVFSYKPVDVGPSGGDDGSGIQCGADT